MSKAILATRDDGVRVLRLFGEWSPDIEKAVSLGDWDLLSLFGVDWETYEPLLPFEDKVRRLRVSAGGGPESSKGLDKLTALEDLELDDFPKPVIDFRKLTNLKKLSVLWDRARKASYLANKNLEYLVIDTFGDKDISVFSGLKKLTHLDIRQGSLQSLSGIKDLHNLKSLRLIRLRNLCDISELRNCSNLELLECGYLPKLIEVEAIRELTELRFMELDAVSAKIKDFNFIETMPNLERLMLTVNALDINWEVIANHPGLKWMAITAHADYKLSDDEIIEKLKSTNKHLSEFRRLNGSVPGFVVEWSA